MISTPGKMLIINASSDMLAAYLYAQLEKAEEINNNRLKSWNMYYELPHR